MTTTESVRHFGFCFALRAGCQVMSLPIHGRNPLNGLNGPLEDEILNLNGVLSELWPVLMRRLGAR